MIDQNSQFFAILTAVGEAKQANATALGQPWTFTQMGVGDANDTDPIPSRTQTKLINEWRRAPLNQVRPDPANPNIIITEQVIPPDVGGKWIRELALYDADGDMVAVANCAPSYKPLLAQNTGKTQVIRMNFIVGSTANIVLKIDPAVVLATREYVDLQIIEALAKLDFKHSVLVATTGNIVLSGIQTIDGVLLPADSRVLVKDQTQAKDNGIYVVPAGGAWKRAQDADASVEVTPGLFVHVEKGIANGDSVWQLVTDAPISLGATPLVFEMVAGRTGIIAGTYGAVTVDKYGRVVGGTSPTTLAGHGINDAFTKPETTTAIQQAIANLVASSPAALDTLKELAAALGNDPNFATTMTNALAEKANKATTLGGYGITDAFTKPETTSAIQQSIAALVASSPAALDTLKELADALGNDPNFATSVTNALAGKLPAAGGNYRPTFNSVGIAATAGSMVNLQGGYIGWNESGLGEMHFICNRGNGDGGFTWRSVNANNTQTGPAMSYSYPGILSVPTALFVPAITSNTTVSTQSPGYAGSFIANCAFVATAVANGVAGKAAADSISAVGLASNNPALPFMRQASTGNLVMLKTAASTDTALLAPNGWSKNADTGEIIQWLEYNLGDMASTTLVNVAWPFRFPNQFLNARVSFKLQANAQCAVQGSFSLCTVDGCTIRVEEWAGVVQTGLVLMVEARGN